MDRRGRKSTRSKRKDSEERSKSRRDSEEKSRDKRKSRKGSARRRDSESGSKGSKGRGGSRDKNSDNGSRRGSQEDDRSNRSPSEEKEKEIPVEDVRKHILQHYGISAEEEKLRKERKAEKFRNYVQNSGLQLAFQLVISEVISKGIKKDQVFKYSIKRFREIGKEYAEIKKTIKDGDEKKKR